MTRPCVAGALRALAPDVGTDSFAPLPRGERALAAGEIARATRDDIYREPVIVARRRLLHEHMTAELARAPRRRR